MVATAQRHNFQQLNRLAVQKQKDEPPHIYKENDEPTGFRNNRAWAKALPRSEIMTAINW
jgi:hypothetical protein